MKQDMENPWPLTPLVLHPLNCQQLFSHKILDIPNNSEVLFYVSIKDGCHESYLVPILLYKSKLF